LPKLNNSWNARKSPTLHFEGQSEDKSRVQEDEDGDLQVPRRRRSSEKGEALEVKLIIEHRD